MSGTNVSPIESDIFSLLIFLATFLISGILSRQGDDVVRAYEEYFDNVKIASTKNGWVSSYDTVNAVLLHVLI